MAVQSKKTRALAKCHYDRCNQQAEYRSNLHLSIDATRLCAHMNIKPWSFVDNFCFEGIRIFDSEKGLISTILRYRVDISTQIKRAGSVVILQDNKVLKVYSGKKNKTKTKTLKTIAPKIKVKTKTYKISDSLTYGK